MRTLYLSLSLAALVGCGGKPAEAGAETTEAELEFPGPEEKQAQDEAVMRAEEAVTESNADDYLEDLEALIEGEGD